MQTSEAVPGILNWFWGVGGAGSEFRARPLWGHWAEGGMATAFKEAPTMHP